jgi:predicted 3-demethylubiquinone-9 3-methyltransferase (glyoxalase superfamily)
MHSLPQAPTIAAGFHSAMPYLIFDGTAAEAIAFYCDAFGSAELRAGLRIQLEEF